MDRRNVIAGVVVLIGVPALVWWALGTDDPRATLTAISIIAAVGMAIVLVVALVVDTRHFAQAAGRPHRLLLPLLLASQGLALLSGLDGDLPWLTVAIGLSMAATVIVWIRIRRAGSATSRSRVSG